MRLDFFFLKIHNYLVASVYQVCSDSVWEFYCISFILYCKDQASVWLESQCESSISVLQCDWSKASNTTHLALSNCCQSVFLFHSIWEVLGSTEKKQALWLISTMKSWCWCLWAGQQRVMRSVVHSLQEAENTSEEDLREFVVRA